MDILLLLVDDVTVVVVVVTKIIEGKIVYFCLSLCFFSSLFIFLL